MNRFTDNIIENGMEQVFIKQKYILQLALLLLRKIVLGWLKEWASMVYSLATFKANLTDGLIRRCMFPDSETSWMTIQHYTIWAVWLYSFHKQINLPS